MGVFDDTTSSPCLEIVKETYEQMDHVAITSATEKIVPCTHTDSSQVKSVSVFLYIEYLFMWAELYCLRKSNRPTFKQNCQKYYDVRNKKCLTYKYPGIHISSTVGHIKTLYFIREY